MLKEHEIEAEIARLQMMLEFIRSNTMLRLRSIHTELLRIYGVDVLSTGNTNISTCKYVTMLWLRSVGYNYHLIAGIFEMRSDSVRQAVKKAEWYKKSSDNLFMYWYNIIEKIK